MSEGASSTAAPGAFKQTPGLTLLTMSVVTASLMQSLDGTIANVVLPHIQGNMNSSLDQVTWVITSYVVAAAIFTPLTSFLAARLGRKRLFLIAVGGFTLASVLCGAAQNLEEIVSFRILQGASGAFLVPLSQAIVLDAYPRERHASVMSVWAMATMTGPIFGPTLGGYLTEFYSWRWAFYINMPIGILSMVGCYFFFTETKRQPQYRFDLLGFAMLSIAIGAFQLMLDRGTTLDWFSSREIVIETILASITFYIFLTHSLTTSESYIRTKMFRNANFCIGLSLYLIIFMVIFSSSAVLPTMMQSLMGYPVIDASMLMMPRALSMLIMTGLSGRLPSMDPRILVVIGIMLVTVSMWQMSGFDLNTPMQLLVISSTVQGAGMGMISVPMMTLTFSTLDPVYRTEGSVMFAMVRSLSISIGVSVVATLLARGTQANHAELVEHINAFSHALQFIAPQALTSVQSAAAIDVEVNRQASMIAYVSIFRAEAFLIAALVFPVMLMRVVKIPTPAAAPAE